MGIIFLFRLIYLIERGLKEILSFKIYINIFNFMGFLGGGGERTNFYR